jgi:hypothetical protein
MNSLEIKNYSKPSLLLLQVSLLDKIFEHQTEENIKLKQFKVNKGAGTIETAFH